MIKDTVKQQIITDYKNGISLRKTAARNKVSLATVVKFTRDLNSPSQEKKNTIKEKNIYIYKDINNISTLNNKDIYNKDNIYKEIRNIEDTEIQNNIENKNDTKENININIQDRLITNIESNKSIDHKQLKVINSSINKILSELKGIDYQKEKLKDLTTSLNALNKQKQDITGTASGNTSIIQQIFNSPEQVQALLKEIQESKANPEAYIIKQQALAEQ
jgi:hypothetical protein